MVRSKIWTAAILAGVLAIGAGSLTSGKIAISDLTAAARFARRIPTGSPQLVAVTPLPETDGEMCEGVPASTQTLLVAALRQERLSAKPAGGAAPDNEPRLAVDADRAPVRDRKSTRLNSSHIQKSRMPSSA